MGVQNHPESLTNVIQTFFSGRCSYPYQNQCQVFLFLLKEGYLYPKMKAGLFLHPPHVPGPGSPHLLSFEEQGTGIVNEQGHLPPLLSELKVAMGFYQSSRVTHTQAQREDGNCQHW